MPNSTDLDNMLDTDKNLNSSAIEMKNVKNHDKKKDEEILEENDENEEVCDENDEVPEDMAIDNIENPILSEIDGRRARKVNNNTYVAKKTAAQGLMDIALLTANANQLRYVIEYSSSTLSLTISIILISISLLLQIGVGITLAFQGRYYYRGESKKKSCKNLKNYTIIGVFLITIINVFIASFTQIVPRDQLVKSDAK